MTDEASSLLFWLLLWLLFLLSMSSRSGSTAMKEEEVEDNDAVVVSSIGVFMLMLLITRRLYSCCSVRRREATYQTPFSYLGRFGKPWRRVHAFHHSTETNRGVKALGKLRVHSSVDHAHEQRTSSWKTPMSRYTSLFLYHLSSDELHRLYEWRNLLFRHIRGVFFFFFCVCAYVRFFILLVMKRITSLPSFLVSIVLFYLCIPHLMDLFNYGSIIHIEWLPGLIFIVITTVGEFS